MASRTTLDGVLEALPWASTWSRLALWKRRAIKTVVAVVALILVSSVLYHYVMIVFEGRPQSYGHSLQVVIETATGTGYGSDSPWESPVSNAFVAVLDLSTFLLVFIIVPYVFRPVLENALSPTLPTSVETSDHVVLCGIEQQRERLIDEFENRGVDYVVIVDSEETALELLERDVPIVFGETTSVETHRNACVDAASAVVVDTEDKRSVSVLLAIGAVNETIRTVVLVDSLDHEQHLSYAGADRVVTPRHLLGRRIVERITTEISPARSDSVELGSDRSMLELSVFEDSPINGRSVAEVETATEGDVAVLGMWKTGRFVGSPEPDTVVDSATTLLLAGSTAAVRELEERTYQGRDVAPTVIIAGHGVVGSTVRRGLERSTVECVVVDIAAGEAVDVVGDATETETLQAAGVESATVLVVAIRDDDEAIMVSLLADRLASELDVIVRMNDDDNRTKVRRAGADYVLSLPEMSGRVLAQEVLREDLVSYGRQLKAIRIDADPYAGRALSDTELAAADCIVVAIDRDGELHTDVPPTFELRGDEEIVVVGRDEDVDSLPG